MGAFAIKKEELLGKVKNKLMSNLNVFQHKKHIWADKSKFDFP